MRQVLIIDCEVVTLGVERREKLDIRVSATGLESVGEALKKAQRILSDPTYRPEVRRDG